MFFPVMFNLVVEDIERVYLSNSTVGSLEKGFVLPMAILFLPSPSNWVIRVSPGLETFSRWWSPNKWLVHANFIFQLHSKLTYRIKVLILNNISKCSKNSFVRNSIKNGFEMGIMLLGIADPCVCSLLPLKYRQENLVRHLVQWIKLRQLSKRSKRRKRRRKMKKRKEKK